MALGFPGGILVKDPCRRRKRCRFNPWVGKIAWRRKWQRTPAFLPGESHGQRSLAGYIPGGHKESDMTEHAHTHKHTQTHTHTHTPHTHQGPTSAPQITQGQALLSVHHSNWQDHSIVVWAGDWFLWHILHKKQLVKGLRWSEFSCSNSQLESKSKAHFPFWFSMKDEEYGMRVKVRWYSS